MFARFGAHVTVVQRAERLLPAEEPELSDAVRQGFAADGIHVLCGTTYVAVDGEAGAIRVGCEDAEHTEVTATHLLIAAGRTPNSDTLGLDHLGLEPDDAGYLPVDEHLRTGVEDVWAIGDLRGGPMFTHTARDEILGCHIAGPDAGNLVHEAGIAMNTGATYGDIGPAIHMHPTLAEGVNAAAGGVHRPARD